MMPSCQTVCTLVKGWYTFVLMQTVAVSNAQSTEDTLISWLETHYQLTVVIFAVLIFLGFLINSPALSDDLDASHGSIGRTMLQSGDWVTPRLDGIVYLEKSPLPYWAITICFWIFGIHDWAA